MTKKRETDESVKDAKSQTFLDRLFIERDELADWLMKLTTFTNGPVFPTLDQEERKRLARQRTAMAHYLEILNARIAYHEKKEQTT